MSIKPEIFYPKSFSYFVNTSPKQELNSKKCKKFLTEVRDILNENNISYFLLFGTLLGAYRENDFIKHDRDIDIGILGESKEDFEKKIEEQLQTDLKANLKTKTKQRIFDTFESSNQIDIAFFYQPILTKNLNIINAFEIKVHAVLPENLPVKNPNGLMFYEIIDQQI